MADDEWDMKVETQRRRGAQLSAMAIGDGKQRQVKGNEAKVISDSKLSSSEEIRRRPHHHPTRAIHHRASIAGTPS